AAGYPTLIIWPVKRSSSFLLITSVRMRRRWYSGYLLWALARPCYSLTTIRRMERGRCWTSWPPPIRVFTSFTAAAGWELDPPTWQVLIGHTNTDTRHS